MSSAPPGHLSERFLSFVPVILLLGIFSACGKAGSTQIPTTPVENGNGGHAGDGTGASPASVGTTGNTRRLRRLSNTEYNNVVRDLLGDVTRPASDFIADTYQNGYDNGSVGLVVESDQVSWYQSAAESLAATAVTDLPHLLQGCDPAPTADGELACRDRFLVSFVPRAFRRPITEAERTRLLGIYQVGADAGGFLLGVQLAIETVLQSPEFLYREELGPSVPTSNTAVPPGTVRLTDNEIASELSFMLSGSMPDDDLRAAIANGRFKGPDDYQREARRLLATAGARDTMRRFFHHWLGTHELNSAVKDAAVYPQFGHALAASMSVELDQDFDQVLWSGTASLRELFTSTQSFVDPALATLYGTTVAGPGFGPVSLDPAIRAGVLTRAGFLTTHADWDSSGPVARGVFVLGSVLCLRPPPPPPDVPAPPSVAVAVTNHQTTRQRFDQHVSNPQCASCHTVIDGIGFGFEEFDGIGAHRTTENGNSVDSSGSLIGTGAGDGPFVGGSELAGRLVAGQRLPDCFVKQMFRFAMGQVETDADQALISALGDGFSVDRRVPDLLLALVARPEFVLRTTSQPPP